MRGAIVLLAILSLALAVRTAAAVLWQTRMEPGVEFVFGDSASYWELAARVATGKSYAYGPEQARVFRTPGYPVLLAPLFVLRDSPPILWGRLTSALWMTLSVGGVYWLAWMMFDVRVAAVAALCAALYPGAVALGALVLSEAPFCALLPVQLGLWTVAWRTPSRAPRTAWLLASGAVAGLATLVRPSWLLFTPFAIITGLLIVAERKRQLVDAAPLLMGLTLVMAPWWIRNAQLTGRFIPTTLQVGASLYDGLNPQADGGSQMNFVAAGVAAFDATHPQQTRIAREVALDGWFRQEAIDWAAANPHRAVQLAGVKFLRMWNVWPNEPQFRRWPIRLAVLISYVPVLVLGLAGGWYFADRGWPYVLCLLPAVYLTLLHMVFVSSIRYRIPPLLPLMVLAAGMLLQILQPNQKAGPPVVASGE